MDTKYSSINGKSMVKAWFWEAENPLLLLERRDGKKPRAERLTREILVKSHGSHVL